MNMTTNQEHRDHPHRTLIIYFTREHPCNIRVPTPTRFVALLELIQPTSASDGGYLRYNLNPTR